MTNKAKSITKYLLSAYNDVLVDTVSDKMDDKAGPVLRHFIIELGKLRHVIRHIQRNLPERLDQGDGVSSP